MAFEWLTDPIGNLAGWIVGTGVAGTPSAASMQASIDETDAQLRDLNTVDYGPGGRIYESIEARRGHAAAENANALVMQHDTSTDVSAQLAAAGREGAQGALQTGLNVPFSFVRSIPWQVWFFGAVALFFWMGGGLWLVKKTKGILAR